MTNNDWSDFSLDEDVCSICESGTVPPNGPENSPVLIIGEFPGRDEIRYGKPFVGATGRVFELELRKVGIDIKQMRLCNLWQHKKTKNAECFDEGLEIVIKEAKGKKVILLVGSDVVEFFCDEKVSTVSGLEVDCKMLSARTLATVQPATVFHKNVGELRLAMERFGKLLEEEGII